MWFDEAMQTIALVEHLHLRGASLAGTSGGAWAAMNAALERPDLFDRIVADSFDGRTLNEHFADNLLKEREGAKADLQARQFYEWCQGADWEKVVDLDTEALLQCAKEKTPLFRKSLEELKVPVLFLGSREDEMCRGNLEQEYKEMAAAVPEASVYMFSHGGHPAIASNAEEAAGVIATFLKGGK